VSLVQLDPTGKKARKMILWQEPDQVYALNINFNAKVLLSPKLKLSVYWSSSTRLYLVVQFCRATVRRTITHGLACLQKFAVDLVL
jgi:hypothetical protein